MQLASSRVVLALLAARGAHAAPQGLGSIINPLECLAVNAIVNTIKALPSATPFCSSFLGISTVTCSTTTTTTLPVVTVTSATTVATNTITPPPVTTTVTSTSTVSSCSLAPVTAGAQKRQLFPLPLPGPLGGIESAIISTACSCLSIPTPTTTVTATATSSPTSTLTQLVTATVTAATPTVTSTTTTVTTIAACPTAQTCNNNGLQYGAFKNTYGYNSDTGYTQYQVATIKAPNGASNVLYTSTVAVPGFGTGNCNAGTQITIYGATQTLPCQYWVLNHRGYFFAPVAGTYTFTIYNTDDIALIWLGPNARSGWTRANSNALAAASTPGRTASATITLTQGQYLPIRIVFAQAQQTGYGLSFAVTAPNGNRIIDSSVSTAASPYLRQNGCDGTTAPAYTQAFGAET